MDLESASDLFSNLQIVDTKHKNQNMKDMDTVPVSEVSDIPGRRWREVVSDGFNIPSYNPRKSSGRKKHKWKESARHTVGSTTTSSTRNDPENLSRRSSLVCTKSETLDMEPSSHAQDSSERNMSSFGNSRKDAFHDSHHPPHRGSRWRRKGREHFPVTDESDINVKARDKGKRTVLSGGTLQLGASRTAVWQRKPERNGYISPCNTSKSGISNVGDGKFLNSSVIEKPRTSYVSVHDQDCNEATDSQNISEYRHADMKEAEVLLDHSFERHKQKGKAQSHFGRVCSTLEREVAVISDDDESLRSREDMGGRRTYDLTGKAPLYSLQERVSDFRKGKDTYSCLSDQSCEIATGYRDNVNHVFDSQGLTASHSISNPSSLQTPSLSESENLRCQRRQKLMKEKRKNNSVHFNYHGCSSLTNDVSEISYHQSSGHFPNSKLTRGYDSQHQGAGFGPVIEIDEPQCSFLPEQSCVAPDDSGAKTSQVESDEMLARQLQEQFYNELPSFSGTQVDAAMAWSLQQDDARQSASTARSSQFNNRDASMAHLYAYYAQLPQSTNHAHTPTSSSRRIHYGTEMDYETRMMAEVRRNFNSGTMGREMRHNLLEALEATFDYSNDMFTENVLQTHGDFDGNDYEMLLALDENNHPHLGASESQINSLPQSTIQSDNVEEACAICLEAPSMGDVIRLLPCLHKFHKECIDTWLRRKSSCPVCKYDI